MIIAFTGIRDVLPVEQVTIDAAVADEIANGATVMRFGGARGADTYALLAAAGKGVRCVVIVPFKVANQPRAAREAIEQYADQVVELGQVPGTNPAYHKRNAHLLLGHPDSPGRADRCVGFMAMRRHGGTFATMRLAEREKIPVRAVLVQGGEPPSPRLDNQLELEVPYLGSGSKPNVGSVVKPKRRNPR